MTATAEYLSEILVPLDFFTEDFKARQIHIENLLCRYLNTKSVIAFIGAGTSQPLGYPGWGDFATDILTILKICFGKDVPPKAQIGAFLANPVGISRKSRESKKDWVERMEIYKSVLQSLATTNSTELEDVKKNYFTNKKFDDKNFDVFLEYLNRERENELNALFIFSECERLLCTKEEWKEVKRSSLFRKIISRYFQALQNRAADYAGSTKIIDKKSNPYIALQELPIKKFITFNYDLEIERALLCKEKIAHSLGKTVYERNDIPGAKNEEILKQFGGKSFSQKNEERDNLAKFSVARYDEADYSVFHCHGRIDDVSSCIVSEEDYQKWYLKENKEQFMPFRQTLNLALESNPILFMGFGLKDADLMRLLRQITANRPIDKTRTPLFCLLYIGKNEIREVAVDKGRDSYKWECVDELYDECTALYMKYGLHVIPVFEAKGTGNENAICKKLEDLRDRWKEWWEGILLKPLFRKSPMEYAKKPARDYFHYKFVPTGVIEKVNERLIRRLENLLEPHPDVENPHAGTDLLDEFKEMKVETPPKLSRKGGTEIRAPEEHLQGVDLTQDEKDPSQNGKLTADKIGFARRLAVVIGDGGTGKSWTVQKFLQNILTQEKKCRVFFLERLLFQRCYYRDRPPY